MKGIILICFSIISLMFSFSLSAQTCEPWIENMSIINGTIKRIDLTVNNIFNLEDAQENRLFHRVANKARTKTQYFVVKRQLLFVEGDQVDLKLLKESERILRSRSYLKEAKIFPSLVCEDGVVITVITKDNWSLQPGFGYGISSGQSKYSFEIQEKNLFGLGKSLEFKYKKGLERVEKSIKFSDTNWLGSSQKLFINYQSNSDGNLSHFNFQNPFVSLHTKNAWGINLFNRTLINSIYTAGEITNEIGQNIEQYTLSMGKLMSAEDDSYHRISWGITSDHSDFYNTELFPDAELPAERNYQYPWLAYEYLVENYIEKTNFNSMGRTEDILLGHHLRAKLGQDVSQARTYFDVSYQKGHLLSKNNFISINAYSHGILDVDKFLNSHIGFTAKWHYFQNQSKTFYVSSNLDFGNQLYAEQPQYLGGETGLRGYPFRYLAGTNKFITSIEQRFFHDWYPLKSFQFASVLFIDTGTVWGTGAERKLFSNIGVGLRLVPTRTAGGQIIHIDVGVPITSAASLDNFQIQIKAKKSF